MLATLGSGHRRHHRRCHHHPHHHHCPHRLHWLHDCEQKYFQHCYRQISEDMFRLSEGGRCEDIDECATDNGGCQQVHDDDDDDDDDDEYLRRCV